LDLSAVYLDRNPAIGVDRHNVFLSLLLIAPSGLLYIIGIWYRRLVGKNCWEFSEIEAIFTPDTFIADFDLFLEQHS
jgi:hypothetical protein